MCTAGKNYARSPFSRLKKHITSSGDVGADAERLEAHYARYTINLFPLNSRAAARSARGILFPQNR
jgi:hypothetical protein